MTIDLNGSASGVNYATNYNIGQAATGVVGSGVRVGTGSATVNSDGTRYIALQFLNPSPGDTWVLGALPSGVYLYSSLSGNPITVPGEYAAWTFPTLYLSYNRSNPFINGSSITDQAWQSALQAVQYRNSQFTGAPETRAIRISEYTASSSVMAETQIAVNVPPQAIADDGQAQEAGGTSNSVAGSSATGNVLANDRDGDVGDTLAVTGLRFGAIAGTLGTELSGTYGKLTLNRDGTYRYVVSDNAAAVQQLRAGATVSDTFSYTVTDSGGLSASADLVITVRGANDAPIDLGTGTRYVNGVPGVQVDAPALLGAYVGFTMALTVTPTELIQLKAQSTSGAAGVTGQHFAVTAMHGQANWGSASHAGVGISVGTNGISVYQHTSNVLSALLTWAGTVGPDTQVAVVFTNNTPTLYVNGVAVATGLTSTLTLHPSTELGGAGSYGRFNGDLSDALVWGEALSASQVAANVTRGISPYESGIVYAQLSSSVSEDIMVGMVVTRAWARDMDSGDTITYSLSDNAAGRFAINAATGEIWVAAPLDYESAASHNVTVVATDSAGASISKTITVRLTDANDAPIAADDLGLATEAGGVNNAIPGASARGNVLDNDTDQDGERPRVFSVRFGNEGGALGYALEGAYGSLTLNQDGSYVYVVDENNSAVQALRAGGVPLTETFTYIISDFVGAGSQADLVIRINGANDAPVAVADAAIAGEAGGVANATAGTNPSGNVLANDTDVDAGDTKTVVGVSWGATAGTVGAQLAGAYGQLALNADGSYTYTVNNANAQVQALRTAADTLTDSFTYSMRDAAGLTSSATLTVTVRGANDAPVAANDTALATEAGGVNNGTAGVDPSGNVLANDTDVDAGDTRSVASFRYGSTAGTLGSELAGAYGRLRMNADGSYTYQVDNANAAVQALRTASNTLVDSFSYTVQDAGGLTSTATLSITIQGANDAPVAVADFLDVTEAGGVNNGTPGAAGYIELRANDFDVDAGDSTSVPYWSGNISPHGTVSIWSGGGFYFAVNDSSAAVQALRTYNDVLLVPYTYWLRDASGAMVTGTVTVRIHGANDAPLAVADVATAVEAGGIANGTAGTNPSGNVLTNDTDPDTGDTRTVTAVGWGATAGTVGTELAGAYGRLLLNANGSYTYTVDNANAQVQGLRTAAETLADSFTYSMRDAAGLTGSATLTVTVQGANDAPVAVNDAAQATEAGGVNDGTPGIDPSGNVLANDSDVDAGDTKRVVAVKWGSIAGAVGAQLAGAYGHLILNADGSYTYSVDNANAQVQALPTANDTLTDSFIYTVRDAAGLESSASLTVTVRGAPDAPVTVADTADATEAGGVNNGTLGTNPSGNVLDNDSDRDAGETKTVIAVAHGTTEGSPGVELLGAYGRLLLNGDGSYTYTVDNSHPQVQALRRDSAPLTDSFHYTVRDSSLLTSRATLTVKVQGANDAPLELDVGTRYANGVPAQPVPPATLLGSYASFTMGFTVSPTQTIELVQTSNFGPSGVPGQHYAITPVDGEATWGESHAGIGVSVGTNGIAVFQRGKLGVFMITTSLLTWDGAVGADTQVGIVFAGNTPTLYVNGQAVATGIRSTQSYLHPSTVLGGGGESDFGEGASFTGLLSDVVVWDRALSAADLAANLTRGIGAREPGVVSAQLLTSIPENAAAGTAVATFVAQDPDGDAVSYSLSDDAQGRFAIDPTTGTLTLAAGASLDYEAAPSYSVTVVATDPEGSSTSRQYTVRVSNVNEAPTSLEPLEAGARYVDGVPQQAVPSAPALGSYASFTMGFTVTPTESITLVEPGDFGVSGSLGQHYAITPVDGGAIWGARHVGIGVSVGTNGISVYQRGGFEQVGVTGFTIPLLTWAGAVGPGTQVSVTFADKTPTLYVNGQAVATGTRSTQDFLHPSTVLGGEGEATFAGDAAFTGLLSDVVVWNRALTAEEVTGNLTRGLGAHDAGVVSAQLLTGIPENAAPGTVVATFVTTDPDSNDVIRYSLSDDAQGRFTIDPSTGKLMVAPGASLDYETAHSYDVTVVATDAGGLSISRQYTVRVSNVNESPVAHDDVDRAVEAGGVNNATLGVDPIGNVLTNDTDVDAGDTRKVIYVDSAPDDGFVGVPLKGMYGTLLMQEDGRYSYTVTNENTQVQALRTRDQTLVDDFTYAIRDAQGSTSTAHLAITIEGANDNPVAHDDEAHATEAGGATSGTNASGNVLDNDTDVDAGDSKRVTQMMRPVTNGVLVSYLHDAAVGTLPARYGELEFGSDGHFVYRLDNTKAAVQQLRVGESLTESFTYTVVDGANAPSTATLKVVIDGTNDTPVASAVAAEAREAGGTDNGTLGLDPTGNLLAFVSDVDASDTLRISGVRLGNNAQVAPGVAIDGTYGKLKVEADGRYTYTVNNTLAAVEALRGPGNTLTDSFTYFVTDGTAVTSAPLDFTIKGADDAPRGLEMGLRYTAGTPAVSTGGTGSVLGAYANFTMAVTVSPADAIVLKAQQTTGVGGVSGQHYAISPRHGEATWGTGHAGVGLSVGTNGISVYQHTSNLLSPLLTWTGAVGPHSQVAVVFVDSKPTLYVNGVQVATGLKSTLTLHPSAETGGAGSWGSYSGMVSDAVVWNRALGAAEVAATVGRGIAASEEGIISARLLTSVPEGTAGGTAIGPVWAKDVDSGDVVTYSLANNADGRFTIDATTGVVSLAAGASLNYEAASSHDITVVATDRDGLSMSRTVTVRVTNEAPVATGGSATMAEDNYYSIRATLTGTQETAQGPIAVMRVDSVPAPDKGTLTLDGQPVAVGDTITSDQAARMVYTPKLFTPQAFGYTDAGGGGVEALKAVRIDSLPDAAQGVLYLDGQPLAQGQVVAASMLDRLRFAPAQDFNGAATFRYSVQDKGDAFSAQPATFTINVTPVNDTPTLGHLLVHDVREGADTRLTNLSFGDVDAGSGLVTVSLRASEGSLKAMGTAQVQVTGSGTDELTLTGSVADINAFVGGADGVTYSARTYERPSITTTIEKIDSDQDSPDPLVRVVFNAQAGTFAAGDRVGIQISGNGTDTVTLVGRASTLDTYLSQEQGLTHVDEPHTPDLRIRISDNGLTGEDPGLTGTPQNEEAIRHVMLRAIPVGVDLAPPVLATGGQSTAAFAAGISVPTLLALGIGATFVVAGVSFFQRVQEAGGSIVESVSACFGVNSDGEEYELVDMDGDRARFPHDRFGAERMVVPGASVGQVVAGIVVVGGALSLLGYLIYRLFGGGTHVNEAPTIEGLQELEVREDGSAKLTNLSFADSDAGGLMEEVNLSVDIGTLSGASAGNVTVTRSSDGRTLTIKGSIEDINAYIASGTGVNYTPEPNSTQQAKLTVRINDNGNSGSGGAKEASGEETIRITAVDDAPVAQDHTVEVFSRKQAITLSAQDFPFTDVENQTLAAVTIVSLPAVGALLLNGQPVAVGASISKADLDAGKLQYVPATTGLPANGQVQFSFQLQDSGSTSNGGQVLSATKTFTFAYQPALTLELDGPMDRADVQTTYDQGLEDAAVLVKTPEITLPAGRSPTVDYIVVHGSGMKWGDRLAVDAVKFAEDYAQLHPGGAVPQLVQQQLPDGGWELRLTSGGTTVQMPARDAQALIQALRYASDSPNPDEGARSLVVQLVDSQGVESNEGTVTLQVSSTLGEAGRQAALDDAALMTLLQAARPQDQTFQSDQFKVATLFHVSRADLLEAVWDVLGRSWKGGELLQAGSSLVQALTALDITGWSQDSGAIGSNGNEARTEATAGLLFLDASSGALHFSEVTRDALLLQVQQMRVHQLSGVYEQLLSMLDGAVSDGGLLRLPDARWLFDTFTHLGIARPDIVDAADPRAALLSQPGLLVRDPLGSIWFTPAVYADLGQDVTVHKVHALGATTPLLVLAAQAMEFAPLQDGFKLVSAKVVEWLRLAGVPCPPVLEEESAAGATWANSTGKIFETADGRVKMTIATQLGLFEAIAAAASEASAVGTPAGELQRLLEAAQGQNGVFTLPVSASKLLADLGLTYQAVSDLEASAKRSVEVDESIRMSAETRDALLAQLKAMTQVGFELGNEVPLTSVTLLALESLHAASQVQLPSGLHLKQVDVTPGLLAKLAESGFRIADKALLTPDALDDLARNPEGCVLALDSAQQVLLIPVQTWASLHEAHRMLVAEELGNVDALFPPVEPEVAIPLPQEGAGIHAALVGATENIGLPLATEVWTTTISAVNWLGLLAAGEGQMATAAGGTVALRTFSGSVELLQSVLAEAGFSSHGLGAPAQLAAQQVAELASTDDIAIVLTAEGRPAVSAAVMAQVETILGAQYHLERSLVARAVLGELAYLQPVSHVWMQASAAGGGRELAAGDPLLDGLVAVPAALLDHLAQLGVAAPELVAVTGQPTQEQLQALRAGERALLQAGTDTVLMTQASHSALFSTVAGHMQASRLAAYDAMPAWSGSPVGTTPNIYASSEAHDTFVPALLAALSGSSGPTSVVAVTLDPALLDRLHLSWRDGGDASDATQAANALRAAPAGTVIEARGTAHLLYMTDETATRLLAQNAQIQSTSSALPFDAHDAVTQFLTNAHLLSRLEKGQAGEEGQPMILRGDALLTELTACGIVFHDLGTVTPLNNSGVMAELGAVAKYGSDYLVSAATRDAWMDAARTRANAVGGNTLLDLADVPEAESFRFSGIDAHVEPFVRIQEQLEPLLLNAVAGQRSLNGQPLDLWQVAAGTGHLNAAALQALLATAHPELKVEQGIDLDTAQGLEKLASGLVLGLTASNELVMSQATRATVTQALVAAMAHARHDIADHAMGELLDTSWKAGVVTLGHAALVTDLRWLDLETEFPVVEGMAERSGVLGLSQAGEVTMTVETMAALVRAITERSAPTLQTGQAGALLAALEQASFEDGGIRVRVPAGTNLPYAALRVIHQDDIPADGVAGRKSLGDAPMGTVRSAADGSLHMSRSTFELLKAELEGAVNSQYTQAQPGVPAAAAQWLNYLAELEGGALGLQSRDQDLHPPSGWMLVGSGTGLADLLSSVGAAHRTVAVASVAELGQAITSGVLDRTMTLLVLPSGDVWTSAQTLQGVRQVLLDRVAEDTGMDWSSRFAPAPVAESLFHEAIGLSKDVPAAGQKRGLVANSLMADTEELIGLLLAPANATTVDGGMVFGRNGTASKLQDWLQRLPELRLNHNVIEEVAVGTPLQAGQYAVAANGAVVMGATSQGALLNVLNLAYSMLERIAGEEVVRELAALQPIGKSDFVLLSNGTTSDYVKNQSGVQEVLVTDSTGAQRKVTFETVSQVFESYKNATSTSFLSQPYSYVDPADPSRNVNTTKGELYKAYIEMAGTGKYYVATAAGELVITEATADYAARLAARTGLSAEEHLGSMLHGVLQGGNSTQGVVEIHDDRLLGLLENSGARFMLVNSTANLTAPGAVYQVQPGVYQLSDSTAAALLNFSADLADGPGAQRFQALTALRKADLVSDQRSFVEASTDVAVSQQLLRDPADPSQAKTCMEVKLPPALLAWLQDQQIVPSQNSSVNVGSIVAASAATLSVLFDDTKVGYGTNAEGESVLFMSKQAWNATLEKIGALPGTSTHVLVMVDDAQFADQLGGLPYGYQVVDTLAYNGTATSEFTDPVRLAAALRKSANGTVFQDGEGRFWMTPETSRAFTAVLEPIAAEAGVQARGTADPTLEQQSAAYLQLLPQFNGTHVPESPAGSTWKGYAFDTALLPSLQTVGVHMALHTGTDPFAMSGLPLNTYQVIGGRAWVDAKTYEALSKQLIIEGEGLRSSLLADDWQKVIYTDPQGAQHTLWQLSDPFNLLGLSLQQAGVRLINAGAVAAGNLADQLSGNAYARDSHNYALVSDQTYQAMHPVWEEAALTAKSKLYGVLLGTVAGGEVLRQAPILLITDSTLANQILNSSNITLVNGTLDENNLGTADRHALTMPGYIAVAHGSQGGILIGASQLEALTKRVGSTVGSTEGKTQEVLASPPIVAIDALLAGQLDVLGRKLGVLLDANGVPIPVASVDPQTLSADALRQLTGTDGLIVEAADGRLLMSQKTQNGLGLQVHHLAGTAGADLASALVAGLDDLQQTAALNASGAPILDPLGQPGKIVTVPAGAGAWLEKLRALGMAYSLVDATTVVNGASVYDRAVLFATDTPPLAVAINTNGDLEMSSSTYARFLLWGGRYAQMYDTMAAQGSLPSLDALTAPTFAADDTKSVVPYKDWATAGFLFKFMYGQYTGFRSVMNREMHADSILVDRLEAARGQLVPSLKAGTFVPDPAFVQNASPPLRRMLALVGFDLPDDAPMPMQPREKKLERQATSVSTIEANLQMMAREFDDINHMSYPWLKNMLTIMRNRVDADEPIRMAEIDALKPHINELMLAARHVRTAVADASLLDDSSQSEAVISYRDFGDPMMDIGEARTNALGYVRALKDTIESGRPVTKDTLRYMLGTLGDILDEVKAEIDKRAPDKLKTSIEHAIDRAWAEIDQEFNNSEEVKLAKAIKSFSDALQMGRVWTSFGMLYSHMIPAATDAYVAYRMQGEFQGETAEAKALRDLYFSRFGNAFTQSVGTFFSALQAPLAVWPNSGWQKDDWKKVTDAYKQQAQAWEHDVSPLFAVGSQEPTFVNALDRLLKDKQLASKHRAINKWTVDNDLPNVSYQGADLWSAIGGVLSMVWASYDSRPVGNLAYLRGAISFVAGSMMATGDGYGSSWTTRSKGDERAQSDYIHTAGKWGGRWVGYGIGTNWLVLPLYDVIGHAIVLGMNYHQEGQGGTSWGTLGNAITTALYSWGTAGALGYVPMNKWILSAALMKIDFTAVESAVKLNAEIAHLEHDGREVEAAALRMQFWKMVMQAIPYAGTVIAPIWGIYDAATFGSAALTEANFNEAVRQRIAQRLQEVEQSSDPAVPGKTYLQKVLDYATSLQSQDYFYNIEGVVEAFPNLPNGGGRTIKAALVTKVVDGVASSTRDDIHFYPENGAGTVEAHSDEVINVVLPNTGKQSATYVINPAARVTLPDFTTVDGPLLQIDTTAASPGSLNSFHVYDPKVAIKGGAGTDLYYFMTELKTVVRADGTVLAGFITDGAGGSAKDLVSYAFAAPTTLATGGVRIHAGYSYSGHVLYEGIYEYDGSERGDLFTRYSPTESDTIVVYHGGGGRDLFDLRSGNNVVSLSDGSVQFFRTGQDDAQTIGRSLDSRLSLNDERNAALYSDTVQYESLFANKFTPKNANVVNLVAGGDGSSWIEAMGNTVATDVLNGMGWTGGLHFKYSDVNYAVDPSVLSKLVYAGGYEIWTNSNVDRRVGAIDGEFDAIVGTPFDDVFEVGAPAAGVGHTSLIKQVEGVDGADRFIIDAPDIAVISGGRNSFVHLRNDAIGANVVVYEGSRVEVDALDNAALPEAKRKVSVTLEGEGAVEGEPVIEANDPTTVVDATASDVHLSVVAATGWGTIQLGSGAAALTVGSGMERLHVTDNAARDAANKLVTLDFIDAGGVFDLDQLTSLQGAEGTFSAVQSGTDVIYSAIWTGTGGLTTLIEFQTATNADLTEIRIGDGRGTFHSLASLLPLPVPAPEPAPLPSGA